MTPSTPLPDDYLERVYAGVLGKLVGVYVGRPFENWTYHQIQERLGDITYYVHERLGVPLVVIDDDVSGTFAFVRALEEHGCKADLSSAEVGKTWLNNVIEDRTVFWWGGNGISTEHTVYLNLRRGIAAPASGAAETNGRTMAEQIGAQIFIDGWAMVAPGQPALASKLAEAAARVSHDGEAVYAAKLWAAMEAQAFLTSDVDELLETGLAQIPRDSLLARVVADVRKWSATDGDWRVTRQRIEDTYGYDKYHGICHVVPNHAVMIMALVYGARSFHEAVHIVNTSGWDTDCNSGNVACLLALMHSLEAFDDAGPDWLGPLADRAIISSADPGYSINDAATIAYDIANSGRRLAGLEPLAPPKGGARFHFSLPGSVQGFRAAGEQPGVRVSQRQHAGEGSLCIEMDKSSSEVEVLTSTFTPLEVLKVDRNYDMMASPLVYPGQTLSARLHAASDNEAGLTVRLRLKAYQADDELATVDGSSVTLTPGQDGLLEWTIPSSLQNQPIAEIGLAIAGAGTRLHLHSLGWRGTPQLTFQRPSERSQSFWRRAWVSSVGKMLNFGPSFFLAQDRGEGLLYQGTRDWADYRVDVAGFLVGMGGPMGVAVRVQGLNRYYALMLTENKTLALVKAVDDQRVQLAVAPLDWSHDAKYTVSLTARGTRITGRVGDVEVAAEDGDYAGGAAGFVLNGGSLAADSLSVTPA